MQKRWIIIYSLYKGTLLFIYGHSHHKWNYFIKVSHCTTAPVKNTLSVSHIKTLSATMWQDPSLWRWCHLLSTWSTQTVTPTNSKTSNYPITGPIHLFFDSWEHQVFWHEYFPQAVRVITSQLQPITQPSRQNKIWHCTFYTFQYVI